LQKNNRTLGDCVWFATISCGVKRGGREWFS